MNSPKMGVGDDPFVWAHRRADDEGMPAPMPWWRRALESPQLLLAALSVVGALLILPLVLAEPIDRFFNTNSYEPGRWEMAGGEYFVVLGAEGEPSYVSLPSYCGFNADVFEGEVLLEFGADVDDFGPTSVTLVLVAAHDDPNWLGDDSRSVGADGIDLLSYGGRYPDGYNWDTLFYFHCNTGDMVLHRVEGGDDGG